MQSRQIRKFDMLRRVQQFLDANAARLGRVNAMAGRKELDRLVEEMASNERGQATTDQAARGHTAKLAVLRRDLWNHHMRPVATIAAAHLRDVPAFAALRMPRFRVKSAVLVPYAIAMAEAARAYQEVFETNGCDADFADALVAAAAALRAEIDGRAQSIVGRASARDGLKATSQRAVAVIRLLDARVKSVLEDDPATLAAWESAKRIGRGRVASVVRPAEESQALPRELKAA